MDASKYQELSLRTQNTKLQHTEGVLNCALGLASEVGELINLLKKHIFHGHPLDLDLVLDETGDVQWYLSDLVSRFGLDLSAVMEANVKKLEERYVNKGGFSVENSLNRQI